MKITVTEPGKGKPTNPNYLFANQSEEDEENYHEAISNLRWRKFDEANPSLPAFNEDGVTPLEVGTWECELVWQAWDGFGSLPECQWFNCRHPHEDYERRGIDTRQVYIRIKEVEKPLDTAASDYSVFNFDKITNGIRDEHILDTQHEIIEDAFKAGASWSRHKTIEEVVAVIEGRRTDVSGAVDTIIKEARISELSILIEKIKGMI